jgi:hypothetical protein
MDCSNAVITGKVPELDRGDSASNREVLSILTGLIEKNAGRDKGRITHSHGGIGIAQFHSRLNAPVPQTDSLVVKGTGMRYSLALPRRKGYRPKTSQA